MSTKLKPRLPTKLFALGALSRNALQTSDLWYITESANWAIRNVGQSITNHLNQQRLLRSTLTISPRGIRQGIIHFGSLPTLFTQQGIRRAHPSLKTIATVFHIASDKHRRRVQEIDQHIDLFHTASSLTLAALIRSGIAAEKIVRLPLGIDPKIFTSPSPSFRAKIRRQLRIPTDVSVIGSFQKDGIGWAAGSQPKLEKGPDILVETARLASLQRPIHLLLVGPARGYVTTQLTRHNIPFTNIGYVKTLTAVAQYYAALDAYLITARVEGGPLSLLEAWASAVPVISTKVGMVPDYATHKSNALLAAPNDAAALAYNLEKVITNQQLNTALTKRGRLDVQQFAWPHIARQYYQQLYKQYLV